MSKCLVAVTGFLGDTLWASSCAPHIHKEQGISHIDYLIGFPQTKQILLENPYINNVFVQYPHTAYTTPDSLVGYDVVYQLPVNSLIEIPTVSYQKSCGIQNTTKAFPCTLPTGYLPKTYFSKPTIGLSGAWKDFDDKFRDVQEIKTLFEYELPEFDYIVLGNNQGTHAGASNNGYLQMGAEMLKCCLVVGAEGGILNLASALGVRTICATDFTVGLNQRLYNVKNIFDKLTPRAFFGDNLHTNLDTSVVTNSDIVLSMAKIIRNENYI